jgi:hypothetical protein
MTTWDTILKVVPLLVAFGSLAGVLLLWRKAPAESRNMNGSTIEHLSNAQKVLAQQNETYVNKIDELEKRLEAVEVEKDYEIIVHFRTSTPPQVGEVIIKPIVTATVTSQTVFPVKDKLFPFDKETNRK